MVKTYHLEELLLTDELRRQRLEQIRLKNKEAVDFQNKIFGFSIFNNKAGVFETNLKIATPKNYVLGPDDELIVDINGYSEEHYNLTVNADGYIKISKIDFICFLLFISL